MFTFNGKKFKAADFTKGLMNEVTHMAKVEIAERFRTICHPVTGEFPTVIVYGDELTDMSIKIEGSKELLEHITSKLSPGDLQGVNLIEKEKIVAPKVFLSFGWEDKNLANKIADLLTKNGIDTWWAEWEIGSGDSLVEKINHGLGGCTHFVVLLTLTSLDKPWVKQEMDAGLVRMLDDKCKFIPLRYNLPMKDLPPLLAARLSPEVTDTLDLAQLINDIHGISRKPALGKVPRSITLPDTGYSKAATAIAKEFVENSKNGLFNDPNIDVNSLVKRTGLTENDVLDGIYELGKFVKYSFDTIRPRPELFVEFDKNFMPWNPEQDALRLASDILNDKNFPKGAEDIAEQYDWPARRLNPAIAYLIEREICRNSEVLGGAPWIQPRVQEKSEGSIRRFVKSRS